MTQEKGQSKQSTTVKTAQTAPSPKKAGKSASKADKPASTAPVLIVGAGPTGLTMALALTQLGIPCRIVDQLKTPTTQSRAAGIHARTLELLHPLGVTKTLIQQGLKMQHMMLSVDGKPLVKLDYSIVDSPYQFALMLSQAHTEAVLTEALQAAGVVVDRDVTLTDLHQENTEVTATLRDASGQTQEWRGAYLIGCDGAHSTVRTVLNMPFQGVSEPERWVLADVVLEEPESSDEINIQLSEHGVFMAFPLGQSEYRIGANYRAPGYEAEADPTLAECQCLLDLNRPAESKARIAKTNWISTFHISYRKANAFQQGHVFLCGDAAHIHSPAGGQGMNTGIQDAINLAWKLALVYRGQASDTLLTTYNTERHHVAELVLKNTARLTGVVTTKNPVAAWLRNTLVPVASHIEWLRKQMINTLSQVGINYRQSAAVAERWAVPGMAQYLGQLKMGDHSQAGDRAPDATLIPFVKAQSQSAAAAEQPLQLYDLLSLTAHHGLLFIDELEKHEEKHEAKQEEKHQGKHEGKDEETDGEKHEQTNGEKQPSSADFVGEQSSQASAEVTDDTSMTDTAGSTKTAKVTSTTTETAEPSSAETTEATSTRATRTAPADLSALINGLTRKYEPWVQLYLIAPNEALLKKYESYASDRVTLMLDPSRAMAKRYGVYDCAFYLIRPDGYIAYRNQPVSWAACEDYLTRYTQVGSL